MTVVILTRYLLRVNFSERFLFFGHSPRAPIFALEVSGVKLCRALPHVNGDVWRHVVVSLTTTSR